MSHTRNNVDWESATTVLDQASINEGLRIISKQIKQIVGKSLTPPIIHLLDTNPNAPGFSTKLAQKLFHVSKKEKPHNFMIECIESYIQFDENNEPIITNDSLQNMTGGTVIIASAIPNQKQINNLIPLLAKAGAKMVLLASLLKTNDVTLQPNFYAFDCDVSAHELIGYGMPTRTLQNKSSIRTQNQKCQVTLNDQISLTSLLSQGTQRPEDTATQLNDVLASLKKTILLYSKDKVKSDINRMIETQLIPFLKGLAKQNKPIAFFIMKNGATHFAAHILSKLGQCEDLPPFAVHSIHGSRYGKNHVGGEMVWYIKPPQEDFSNTFVIHLEDILEGGKTMDFAMQEINAPREQQFIVALGDKKAKRLPECAHIQPTFKVYEFDPNQFLVGWGLDEKLMSRADLRLTFFAQPEPAVTPQNAAGVCAGTTYQPPIK